MLGSNTTREPLKRVFITGGASGLGRAIALRYAQEGYQVCIGDVNNERGQEVLAELVLDVNLKGVMRGIRAFTPLFKQQNSGYFVNIASAAGLFSPAHMGAYNAAKAGVISLSESTSYELAPFNVGTTVVCPAFFQTNLMENMKFTVDGVGESVDRLMAKSSVSAEDIAEGIFNAVNEKQFMVLPHKMVRQQWIFKRNKPEEFAELMKVEGLKLAQKTRQSNS